MKQTQIPFPVDVPPLGERSPNIRRGGTSTKDGRITFKNFLGAMDEDLIKRVLFPDDEEKIDDDDPRLLSYTDTPGEVRTKIRTWIQSGAQAEADFQKTIGVDPEEYGIYMGYLTSLSDQTGDVHKKASLFFRKRELQGLPIEIPERNVIKPEASKKKKPTKSAAKGKSDSMERLLDTGDYILPGEIEGDVDIFETPREVRRKMRALLAKGVTQAAFARALSKMLPEGSGTLNPQTMKAFLAQKGVMDGNTSKAFYCGYVFFEKQRLRDNKPMSKHRETMEELHPTGVDTTNNPKTTRYCVSASIRSLGHDQYGVMRSYY